MRRDVARTIRRVDELVKHAGNRPDPTVAYHRAGDLLKDAVEALLSTGSDEARTGLVLQVERRMKDLERLMDSARASSPTTGRVTSAAREADPARIPPGQRLVAGWPVLHSGTVPSFDPGSWRFRCTGMVENRLEWTWQQFRALPSVVRTTDFHCVTGWSRLDNTWEGVQFREVAGRAGVHPAATHALIYGETVYSANLPLDVLLAEDVLFAWDHDGMSLAPEHGGPVRLVVPSRYAWKSVKWCHTVQFLDRDVPGYWEERGYHNDADPFLEQRYRAQA